MVVSGAILGIWGGFERRIVTVLTGIVGTGLGILTVGLTPAAAFPLAIVAMFFGAVMNSMTNGSGFALLQQVVAPETQGRVFAVIMSLAQAMAPLGLALAGPLADALGVRFLYIVAGATPILLGTGAFLEPTIMHLEDSPHARIGVKGAPPPI